MRFFFSGGAALLADTGWRWCRVPPLRALVRALGLDGGSLIVPLLAFTPYALIAAFFIARMAAALSNWAAAVIAGLATVLLGAAVLPRAIGDGTVGILRPRDPRRPLPTNIHRGTADPAALVAALVEALPRRTSERSGLTPRPWSASAAGIGAGSCRRPDLGPSRSSRGCRSCRAWGSTRGCRLPPASRARTTTPDPGSALGGDGCPAGAWSASPTSTRHTPKGNRGPPIGESEPPRWKRCRPPDADAPRVLLGDFNATLDQVGSCATSSPAAALRDAGDVAGKGLEADLSPRGATSLHP